MEAAGLTGGVELLTSALIFGKKAKLFPRDAGADEAIKANKISGEDLLTESILRSRGAKTGAQYDEMVEAIKADPTGTQYNAFVNDIGEDAAGKAVVNIEADPLQAKLHQAQIQSNLGTLHGRAAAVADESFVREFTKAIDGNERAQQLDVLFDQISPNFDAEINNGVSNIKVKNVQMNRAVDNLTTALFGQDISFNEFQTIVDDMKSITFGSHEILDEEGWIAASQALKNAYEVMFDPNQMRASAMLTQQAADTVTDTAAAAIMLGDEVDTTRQFQIMFEKLNLLDTEVKANKYINSKALDYTSILESGNLPASVSFLNQQALQFDRYLKATKIHSNKLTQELIGIAKHNPHYFDALKEAYFATDGSVDELHKLHTWAEKNIGLIKKGIIDGDPEIPSLVVKGLHGVRINSVLSGLAAPRAMIGNSMMTAIKPISVFTGALAQGDMAVLKRASYTFGGITENLKRGFKVMAREWKLAAGYPEAAMMRGRADLQLAKLDNFYALEDMAEGWRADGEIGKLAMWNMAKSLSWWTKQHFVKYGTNALYAIDGMTNSFMASGMARARAYDELYKTTHGAQFNEKFAELQRKLYDNAFDSTGALTDEAAKHASQEIALNLDNNTIKKFEEFLDYVPAARSLFLFSRTGINGFNLSWTFNPLSNLGPALSKARKVLAAKTSQQKMAALVEHGVDATQDADLAFNTLRSEYIGRQLMGSGVVMGVGLWALEGNITGSGPEDAGERQRMMSMGWQPYSIKNPITGEWRSYKGFDPFEDVMALTADVIYQADRIDGSATEDWFRKIGHSISMNLTNDTFIGGFEPLLGLISGDPSAWTRFWAGQTDTLVPYKGMRTILSNAITPQLKDVSNDFFAYQKNAHKYFFRRGDQEDPLKDLLDIYTGEPIRYFEPIPAAFNAVLPMFKQNGDMQPWRQWLLSTGWDGLQRLRRNRDTRQPLNDQDRYFINNWVAKNGNLKSQIIALMSEPDSFWDEQLAKYKKLKGLQSQNDFPIRQLLLH